MALTAARRSFQATATSISLPAGTNPKCGIIWTSSSVLAEEVFGSTIWYTVGFFSWDGTTLRQGCMAVSDADAAATMDIWSAQAAPGDATKRVAWVLDGATEKSMSISAVSDTAITVGWTAAPSANIRMHALILGGGDLDAYLADFTTTAAAATQDVSLPTGWGQPKCVFFTTSSRTAGTSSVANDCGPYVSFGIDGTKRWASTWRQDDANTTSTIAATQRQRALVTWNDTTYGSLDAEADLTTTGAPTDGFRLSYSDQASQANQVLALALKGTFTVDTASFTAPTAVAPVTQTPVTMTSTPRAAFFAGWSLPTTAAIDQTHTDLVYSYMGAYAVAVDATTSQGNAGVADDDAQGTSVIGGSGSDTYAVQQYVPAATPTLSSRATASFTGNALTLTWDDTDTIARESWTVVFADAAAAAATIPSLVMLPYRRR